MLSPGFFMPAVDKYSELFYYNRAVVFRITAKYSEIAAGET